MADRPKVLMVALLILLKSFVGWRLHSGFYKTRRAIYLTVIRSSKELKALYSSFLATICYLYILPHS